jgi:hypothetical protein
MAKKSGEEEFGPQMAAERTQIKGEYRKIVDEASFSRACQQGAVRKLN